MVGKNGNVARLFSAVICAGILGACGGGGGAGSAPQAPNNLTSPPAAPIANLTITTKLLSFSWNPVPGATSYRLARNPDGMSGFTQVGASLPAAATSTLLEAPVHLVDWLNARYQIQACNAVGCTPSTDLYSMTGYQQATGYIKASNPESTDQFGMAVALSRDGYTLAVATPYEDSASQGIDGEQSDNSAIDAGAVYVFVRNANSVWSQQAYIKAGNAEAGDHFGDTVALSADGNTLIVGALGESSFATGVNVNALDNTAPNAGAAYVFTRSDGTWSQQAYLKASNAEEDDLFGYEVAISADGNTVAVSAIGEDSGANGIGGSQASNSADSAGAVYLFARSDGTWSQTAYVKSSFSGAVHLFGASLALDAAGQALVVGAIGEGSGATGVNGPQSNNNRPNSGAAYVFRHESGAWSQQAYLKASRATTDLRFGRRVALSGDGNTIAIGTFNEDSSATGIDGDQDSTGATNSGAVYVFAAAGDTWQQQSYVKASNTDADDFFGYALALNDDGRVLAVGAPLEASLTSGINGNQLDNAMNGNAGAVYVFTRSTGSWVQRSYVKPNYMSIDDRFGVALALSGDGNTLAVGSYDDSAASGINGNADDDSLNGAGAVHLY